MLVRSRTCVGNTRVKFESKLLNSCQLAVLENNKKRIKRSRRSEPEGQKVRVTRWKCKKAEKNISR